jgi:hypothetical protein
MTIGICDGLVSPPGGGGGGGGADPTPNIAPAASPLLKRPKPFLGPTVALSLAPPTTTDIAPAASAFDEVL